MSNSISPPRWKASAQSRVSVVIIMNLPTEMLI